MKFDCDDSAYEFYKEYAHRIGFSVRKHSVKRENVGQIIRRTFSCSKEGERVFDKRRENASYRCPISQTGCLAQMTCHLQKDGKQPRTILTDQSVVMAKAIAEVSIATSDVIQEKHHIGKTTK
ncbi:protein FAR1-RELATED SEQUENCE 5-like [Castanea sativa]|uniref:protein FAR1-RELATED SEQUENCE 5-like n=1 Tax=Castanea sativa TaxID=21020 RepID=UPI003F653A89